MLFHIHYVSFNVHIVNMFIHLQYTLFLLLKVYHRCSHLLTLLHYLTFIIIVQYFYICNFILITVWSSLIHNSCLRFANLLIVLIYGYTQCLISYMLSLIFVHYVFIKNYLHIWSFHRLFWVLVIVSYCFVMLTALFNP